MPPEYLPGWLEGLKWMSWLEENYPQWHRVSTRESDPLPWILGYEGETMAVLNWETRQTGVSAYHRWILRRTERGTNVITEEAEKGALAHFFVYNRKMNPAIHAAHEVWLHAMYAELARPEN